MLNLFDALVVLGMVDEHAADHRNVTASRRSTRVASR